MADTTENTNIDTIPAETTNTRLASDYCWDKTLQTRLCHRVDHAIEIITKTPHEVQNLALSTCKCGTYNGQTCVQMTGGMACFFHESRLPMVSANVHPIIVGTMSDGTFIMDGAHRLARWKQSTNRTIPMIVLTEAETRECRRELMDTKIDKDWADRCVCDERSDE